MIKPANPISRITLAAKSVVEARSDEWPMFKDHVTKLCNIAEGLVRSIVGCKWDEIGPLSHRKPEFEKYISEESLLAALIAESKEREKCH